MTRHILLATDDPGVGGVAQYNASILKGLLASGNHVTCLQPRLKSPRSEKFPETRNVRYLWFEENPIPTVIEVFQQSESRPDFIIFSNSNPFSNFSLKQLAIAENIPYLIVEGLVEPHLAQLNLKYLDELSQHYRQAKKVIAVSQDNLQLLHQYFKLSKNQGKVIHYGRPSYYFTPINLNTRKELRQAHNIPLDAIVCFTSARIEARKGYQYQINAIHELKNKSIWSKLYFVWAGGGIFDPKLEIELKEIVLEWKISDRVKFLGQISNVEEWLNAVDIFVFPSELEGMPLCVMEAMAKGLPVVASEVSGIPEELGSTGQLLPHPNKNPQDTVRVLISTLEIWAKDAKMRSEVGQKCKARAEILFREERMIKETLEEIERAELPKGDYISPNFSIVRPDAAFPNMIVGNPQTCNWPYLRREIPHNWYVDRRQPTIGFLSRDEAHILYNTALQFKGKRALEIGCWLGWSTCHLALAGVELDVIDPLLERPKFYNNVRSSLETAGVFNSITLIGGYSPQKVVEIAKQQQCKWSLIFIDGNHEHPGPLEDVQICEQFAEEDAAILFHDLASPDVGAGLDYLRDRDWKIEVYQTMQIMGVAWRGKVQPILHQPDPNISWTLPSHLQGYSVSGTSEIQEKRENGLLLDRLWETTQNCKSFDVNQELIILSPKEFIQSKEQGQKFWIQGKFEDAIAAFEAALKFYPNSRIAHHYLSLLDWRKENISGSIQNHILSQFQHYSNSSREQKEFREIFEKIHPYTMLSEKRLFSLYFLAKQICLDDISGHFVECGTWRGGSTALLAKVIQRYSLRPRLVYGFDTFAGMPEPTKYDRHDGIYANSTEFGRGTLKAPLEENLASVCQLLEVTDLVVPVKGLFSETLPFKKTEIDRIALLHADGDWYESTLDIFSNLYEQIVDRGVIQIDDYGYWEGCRHAIHEFERRHQLSFPLQTIDDTGVWFCKDVTVQECQHWRTFLYLAKVAQQLGDCNLATKATSTLLEILPALREAQSLQLQNEKSSYIPSPLEKQANVRDWQPAQPIIIIDGVFFQRYQTGIARVWKSLLEQWSNSCFARNLIILDRGGTAPKITGIYYKNTPLHDYQNLEQDQIMLQEICDEEGADLFISTYYTTPISTPSVFMGYDMIPELLGGDLNEPMWREKHNGIQHASAYITISQNTAKDLMNCFSDISSEQVTVAYCGVESLFIPANHTEIEKFKNKYDIHKPYFLLIAPNVGYKNATFFFQSFDKLLTKQGFSIVCTGNREMIEQELQKFVPSHKIYILQLRDDELRLAYAGAIALVYPSKYEGFGLPVLEAMACGCPVITTPNSSLPEVAGEAALYVRDDDIEGMIDALCDVQKTSIRQALISAGLQRAKKFSWSTMADIVQNALVETTLLFLNLQDSNLIICPDWLQGEEKIVKILKPVLAKLIAHPKSSKFTLLIEASCLSEDDANLIISGITMELLITEELDIQEGMEISIIPQLDKLQWQVLQRKISGRILLEQENRDLLEELQEIPTYSLDNIPF